MSVFKSLPFSTFSPPFLIALICSALHCCCGNRVALLKSFTPKVLRSVGKATDGHHGPLGKHQRAWHGEEDTGPGRTHGHGVLIKFSRSKLNAA